jgi:predicted ABC-type ATPase
VNEFVNPDVIAQGLSAFEPERVALAAGRVMLARMRDLACRRVDFAFETTLASRRFARWLADLRRNGYCVHLLFLWLPSAALAVGRVAERVRAGGHGVPEETIRRRYRAGVRNFFALYRPLADTWRLYDASRAAPPLLIARGKGRQVTEVVDRRTWARILRGAGDAH